MNYRPTFGLSSIDVEWLHVNNSQNFVLVFQPMLHVKPVLSQLGEKDGPLEGMYIGNLKESFQHTLAECWVSQHVARRLENHHNE